MGLDVGGRDPAGNGGTELDLVPRGRGRILAQDVVEDGGAAGDEANLDVGGAGPRAHVQVQGGGGQQAQLRDGVPGDGQPREAAVGLDVGGRDPAGDAGTELDLVPRGRGRILAQDVVAGRGAAGDEGHPAVGFARSRAHIQVQGGGGQQTQLGRGPGDGDPGEVAVGLDIGGGDPAGNAGTEPDLVPRGRGRVLAQDVVAGGGEGQGDHDPVAGAGPGAQVEAVRGRGQQAQLGRVADGGRLPGNRQVAPVAVQLHAGGRDPAGDTVAVADLVPGGRGRVLAQNRMAVGTANRQGGHPGAGRARCCPHDAGLCGVGQTDSGRQRQIEVAFGLHRVVRGNPANNGGLVTDLVPGGRGGILAQDVVAVRGAAGDGADLVVAGARPRPDVQVLGGAGLEAQLRGPDNRQAGEVAVGLDVVPVHPAGDAVAEADPVPDGGSRVLAQDVVAGGGAAGDRGHPGVGGARTQTHVEPGRGRGQQAQLRGGGHDEAGKVTVGLDEVGGNPAGERVADADLVPGGRGRVLAQDVVAGGGAAGDGVDDGVGSARSGAHVEPGRGRGLQAQLRDGGDREPGEAAVGLHGILGHPAVERVVDADLVPGGRGRILAQDVVTGGRAAGDGGDPDVGGARSGAHVEVGGHGGLEAQLRAGGSGDRKTGKAAVGLHKVLVHPAGNGGLVADPVPAWVRGIPAQQAVPGRAVGGNCGGYGLPDRGPGAHRHRGVSGAAQPGLDCTQSLHVVRGHLAGPHPAPARIRDLQLVPERRKLRDSCPDPTAHKAVVGWRILVREEVRRHSRPRCGRGPRHGAIRKLLRLQIVVGKRFRVVCRQGVLDFHHIPAHPALGIGCSAAKVPVVEGNLVPEVVLRGFVGGQVQNRHPICDVRRNGLLVFQNKLPFGAPDTVLPLENGIAGIRHQFAFCIENVRSRACSHIGICPLFQVLRRGRRLERRGNRHLPVVFALLDISVPHPTDREGVAHDLPPVRGGNGVCEGMGQVPHRIILGDTGNPRGG